MSYLCVVFVLFSFTNAHSQVSISKNIQSLVDTSIVISKKKGVNGFKIQIYMGSDREEAEKIRKTFIKHYPRVKIEYKHEAPYYKIRVGKYYSKRKAYRYLKKIRKNFRNSYLVNVKIK